MKQSTLMNTEHSKLHVAIIMDGNGRWARARGLPRIAGHRAGAESVRRVAEAAAGLGIGTITLYAFSSDNWKRPREEVTALMRLLSSFLKQHTCTLIKNGVRLSFIGRRDRIPEFVRLAVEKSERQTSAGMNLHLRIALDYSSRDAILEACKKARKLTELTREKFAELLLDSPIHDQAAPDVDLLIRTSGEQRLSDFLLWEVAYAELHFTQKMWPDYQAADLEAAVRDFYSRERRFGAAPIAAAG